MSYQRFAHSPERVALHMICAMVPEGVGVEGWLVVMPTAEEQRRAHKIACARRHKTARGAFAAVRRYRRAFPYVWAHAVRETLSLDVDMFGPARARIAASVML